MDITNKAVKVSRRMVEIEDALACGDLMAPEADRIRMEYEELSEWNELLNAYFDCRNKSGDRIAELEREKAELVAQVETVKSAYRNLCGAIGDMDDTEHDSVEQDKAIGVVFEKMREAWQASRAALVVELPQERCNAGERLMNQVRDELDKAGITYKQPRMRG